eukprot:6200571-Pleurochrysis_carterae.AAC.1
MSALPALHTRRFDLRVRLRRSSPPALVCARSADAVERGETRSMLVLQRFQAAESSYMFRNGVAHG